ncbi:hypothetical protein C0J52_22554 [Blattella germanica]|nr:hypothetical protein C0J52_22554 [Blattella germanica]
MGSISVKFIGLLLWRYCTPFSGVVPATCKIYCCDTKDRWQQQQVRPLVACGTRVANPILFWGNREFFPEQADNRPRGQRNLPWADGPLLLFVASQLYSPGERELSHPTSNFQTQEAPGWRVPVLPGQSVTFAEEIFRKSDSNINDSGIKAIVRVGKDDG